MSVLTPCTTPDELHAWVRTHLDMNIPRTSVCDCHSSPFSYLCRAYFEPSADQLVWAPRGGGKTSLAAIATLLDLIHKPGTAVRILGGSLEQSLRMWEHLVPHLQTVCKDNIENPKSTARKITLANKSTAAVLTQSQRSVRGLRVQKVRCDEVELFDPLVWEAAQLVTKSRGRDATFVRGSIEAFSTLHKPFGLMRQLTDAAVATGRTLVKWCLLEVLERCPQDRNCSGCPLWKDCRGVAKEKCDGFVKIDDAIAMKSRVSAEAWQCEMLCRTPSPRGLVFANFDAEQHVRTEPPFDLAEADWTLAMDFGYSAPFVCLWVTRVGDEVFVIDEYLKEQRTLDQHLAEVRRRTWPRAMKIACDPAGNGKSDQTAQQYRPAPCGRLCRSQQTQPNRRRHRARPVRPPKRQRRHQAPHPSALRETDPGHAVLSLRE
ncbi:MAG: hypothetical protein QM754_20455 [Tepidisphaeraceae bacterium]